MSKTAFSISDRSRVDKDFSVKQLESIARSNLRANARYVKSDIFGKIGAISSFEQRDRIFVFFKRKDPLLRLSSVSRRAEELEFS